MQYYNESDEGLKKGILLCHTMKGSSLEFENRAGDRKSNPAYLQTRATIA